MKSVPAIFIAVLLIPAIVFGQNKQWQGQGANAPKILVTGEIIDKETGGPIEYATVALIRVKDSTIATGGVTNAKGKFRIESKPGKYLVRIDFIGYESKTLPPIALRPNGGNQNLGKILLSTDTKTLEAVEITAEKSQVEYQIDKKVFNVDKNINSVGGNVVDILENIPSVNVDQDGNVELRGNSNIRILIDGRQSSLVGISGNGGLEQLPANLVEKIEVVTNPSVKYDAEGVGGILNIVLKKDKRDGFNGSFDFSGGYPSLQTGSFNFNYRTGKVNYFGSYGIRNRRTPGISNVFTTTFNDDGTTSLIDQDTDFLRGGLSNTVRFGADYYFDNNTILTGSLLFRYSDQDRLSDVIFQNFENGFLDEISTRNTDGRETEPNYEGNILYEKKFKKEGTKLTADIRYTANSEEEISDFTDEILNFDFTPSGDPTTFQRTTSDESQQNFVFQADYEQPFGKTGKIETGVKFSLRDIETDFLVEDEIGEVLVRNDSLSNTYGYREEVYAIYGQYTDKLGNFSYQIGLRSETTSVFTELIQTEETNNFNYTNFFPSGNFSYKLSNKNSLQLGYSRRLRRPSFRNLNPFFSFNNPQSLRTGNPNLQPSFTQSLELGHLKQWKNATLNTSIYYQRTTDVVQRIVTVDSDGVSISRPENLSDRDLYGLELAGSIEPIDKLNINGSFNVFRSIIDGGNLGEEFAAQTTAVTARGSFRYSFTKRLSSQIQLNYRGAQQTTQGRRDDFLFTDVGFNYSLWKRKGTISFRVRDVFNSFRFESISEGEDFFRESEFMFRPRSYVVGFSYRINQNNRRQQRRRRGNNSGGGFDDFEGGDF